MNCIGLVCAVLSFLNSMDGPTYQSVGYQPQTYQTQAYRVAEPVFPRYQNYGYAQSPMMQSNMMGRNSRGGRNMDGFGYGGPMGMQGMYGNYYEQQELIGIIRTMVAPDTWR